MSGARAPGRTRTLLVAVTACVLSLAGLGAAGLVVPALATGSAGASPVEPNGSLVTLGGSAGSGRGSTVSQDPVSLAAGPGGGVLVADDGSDAVRLLGTSGAETLLAGNGLASYNGDARAATSASLDAPSAVVLDRHGDVLVADSYTNRIRLVAATNCSSGCPYGLPSMVQGSIYTVAGDGVAGFSGDGGPATSAELDTPEGLAVDFSGDILVADTYNNRVRLVASSNCTSSCAFGLPSLVAGDIYTVAGDGMYGYNPSGNGLSAADAELSNPSGLAIDRSGDLILADSGENHVQVVAWQPCPTSCRFGLASLSVGDIYDIAGRLSSGQTGAALGDGGPGTAAQLDSPAGVSVDANGDVVIADTLDDRIRLVAVNSCPASCSFGLPSTTAGDIYTVAGDGTAGYAGDRGPALSAELGAPAAVYVDGAGDLVIGDTGNDRIRVVAAGSCGAGCDYGAGPTTAHDIYTVGGNGILSSSGDGGPATSAELLDPAGLTSDAAGDTIVADTGNDEVRLIAGASCGGGCPYGLGPTAAGDVYGVAGNGVAAFSGDGGRATSAELDHPSGVAAVPGGLVIADTGNNRIRFVASSNCTARCPYGLFATRAGAIYTIAGDGVAGFGGDGRRATLAALDAPTSVAVGELGEILVADTGNNRIRVLADVSCDAACPYGLATGAGDIYTIAGDGALGFSGDGGPARAAALAQPAGVAVGLSGEVLIADSLNNRIRLLATSACSVACPYGLGSTVAGDIYTVAGTGAFGFSGDHGAARAAALADPLAVAVDAAGNAYVADNGNERIRVVSDEHCYAACRFGVASMAPGSIDTVIGSGNLAVSPSGTPASDLSLASPTAVAVDAVGALLIAESGDGGVRRLFPEPTDGFVITTTAGNVYSYGAPWDGSIGAAHLPAPIIGIAADAVAGGYWLVGTDGSVYAFGGARSYGSMGGKHLNKPIVAISPTADGRGYWLVASDGGIFAFGDARFHGSMGGKHLNKPIVGMATSPDGLGYWLVATDGGIFTFGDSKYRGSEGGSPLNKPIFAMASTPDGRGYWLVASDGGIFTFGDAHYHGSLGGFRLKSSIVGMSADPLTGGYRMADEDGRVYPFACPSYGGTDTPVPHPLVAIATDH
jgi:hypothetical protein